MKPLVLGLLTLLAAAPSYAQGVEPTGVYLSQSGNTRVRIGRCGNSYCGTIVSVQGEAKDVNNPDPALRNRSLVGIEIISEVRPSGDGYEGSLYNYKDGKRYTGKITMVGPKSMQLSGCVLGGLICRSEVWTKVQ